MRERADRIAGRLARRFYRRVLTLDEAIDGVSLPEPPAGRACLLYLHIPFCAALCPFCSFHRVVFEQPVAQRYFDALDKDVRRTSGAGFTFDELYVGGGTPTMLPERLIATIDLVRSLHPVSRISLETNPDHLRDANVERLADAGVNRLSVGVQSFDDRLLSEMQRLERYGTGAEIRTRLGRVAGIVDTLNVDMIFNLPHQDEASLQRDLDILVEELAVDQVSFYPLMADGRTRSSMRDVMGEIGYDRERDFFELISSRLLEAGYRRDSVWCFSRNQGMVDEYIVDREEYVGLGSGAFSYVAGTLAANTFSIPRYVELATSGASAAVRRRRMSEREQQHYYLLMQLFGGALDLEQADKRFDGKFSRLLRTELSMLHATGSVDESNGIVTLTDEGRYLWLILMREFFTGINALREQLRHDAEAGHR